VTEFMPIRADTTKDESDSAVSKRGVIASRASEEVTRLLRSSGKSGKEEVAEVEEVEDIKRMSLRAEPCEAWQSTIEIF